MYCQNIYISVYIFFQHLLHVKCSYFDCDVYCFYMHIL